MGWCPVESLARLARFHRRKIARTTGVRKAERMNEIEPRNRREYIKSPGGLRAPRLLNLVYPLPTVAARHRQAAVAFSLLRRQRSSVFREPPPVLSRGSSRFGRRTVGGR